MTAPSREEVSRTLSSMNRAWLEGRPRELESFLDPEIVMMIPGGGHVEGRDALLRSFVEFCEDARIHRFEESERRVDVFGDAAVASIAFSMDYEREGESYRSTGRDLWVFSRIHGSWRAVYRTMLEVAEEPATL